EEVLNRVLSRIRDQQAHSKKRMPQRRLAIYASAVAVVLMVLFAAVFIPKLMKEPQPIEEVVGSFTPGSNKASLKLSNGQPGDLSDAYSGIIVDGRVMYDDGSTVLD